jgi:hypothetical protein
MAKIRQLGMILDTGHVIEVIPQLLSWGIPKKPIDRNDEAIEWFESAGHGDLLKNMIIVQVPADNPGLADKIVQNITSGPGANSIEVSRKCTINHQTLGKFIRGERAAKRDKALPKELLGIYERTVAKVTAPEEPKTPF